MRPKYVLVTALLGTALLAGGVVAAATRADRETATLVALPGDGGDPAAETTPAPTPAATATPTPTPAYALTSPEPPYRVGLPATPDPPRPAGYPLPTGCLSFFHSCAYPGATGAVTGGPDWMGCPRTGPTSVRLTWRTYNLTPQRSWATPTEFVVRAYLLPGRYDNVPMNDPSRLTQARLPVSASSYTFSGLVPGGWYQFEVMELNSSGLAGIACEPVQMASPPSPTASRTPTPAPTPSATPTPTEDATTPTPTATVEP